MYIVKDRYSLKEKSPVLYNWKREYNFKTELGEGKIWHRASVLVTRDLKVSVKKTGFYIDKSDFIREWWESADVMTLITRPRRFWENPQYEYGKLLFFQTSMREDPICLKVCQCGKRKNTENSREPIRSSF